MNEYVISVLESCGGCAVDEDGEFIGVMLHGEKQITQFASKIVQGCRDNFCIGSVSWNLLNEKLECINESL